MKAGAKGGAHAEEAQEIDLKLEAWVAEMEEVIVAWPKIQPAVRMGLLAIVRSRYGASVRTSTNRMT